jgi:molecular chaperone GrpE
MTDERDRTGRLAEETEAAGTSPAAETDESAALAEPVEISYAEYEELKTLARERDEYLQRLQRAVADYQNLQKRIEKFRDAAREGVLRSLAEAILPVADSLGRALEAAEQTEGADNIVEGLRLVEKDFHGALERLDIRPIHAVGHKFDPHYHEAVMQQEAEDAPPNTVLRELKKGFMLGEQVIRPSQVIVSGPAQSEAAPGEESSES